MNERTPLVRVAFSLGRLLCLLLLSAFAVRAEDATVTTAAPAKDLTDLPIEALMQMEVPKVFSASKYEQKATEAPSSTTVITSDEIKRYGYRTLGDVLASVQGFYVANDRDHTFLGTRGLNLGDFNSRILLLVNGHRVNNDLNDGAYIDTAFILDLDLIDRVEIIRGPGSVLYGNNAFFGVINVITRQGKDINGAEVSGSYGSYNAASGRITFGGQLTNGVQFLLSGTMYTSDGAENLYYGQFNTPSQNNGIAHQLDGDGLGSFFGSISYKDFTLEAAFIDRQKDNPTAQYGTTFNAPGLTTDDTRGYTVLKYAHKFPDIVDVSANIYYDQSDFSVGYPFPPLLLKEDQTGQWVGSEVQVDKNIYDRAIVSVGMEIRDDFNQSRRVYDAATGNTSTDVHTHRYNYGIFAQSDVTVVTNLHLNAGIRYDEYEHFDPAWNPRVALIYNPFEKSTFKFIWGTAFRDPNFLEQSAVGFEGIKPEKITSYEAVYEQGIGRNLRTSLSGFYNRMDDLIDFQNGSFINFNADTLGLEAALEGKWENDIRTRLSYSLQHTESRDTDAGLPDSPMHLIKANVSVPLLKDKIFAGLEFQYTSSSHTVFSDLSGDTLAGPDADGYATVNFTIFSQNLVRNLDASVSVYNLLNNQYSVPSTRFHLQNAIQQDGINFRLKLTYRF
ncbi:MAG TPA: TonB-dependent receptor [Verrucomicrobiae bacterium]|nr:TonB-dependent receptor [Verrucomicrobiae bacterium]